MSTCYSIGILPLKEMTDIKWNIVLIKHKYGCQYEHRQFGFVTCNSSYTVMSWDCAGEREVGEGGKTAACREGYAANAIWRVADSAYHGCLLLILLVAYTIQKHYTDENIMRDISN